MLIAIIGFMPTPGNGAVAALDYTPEERKNLAKKSCNWKCNICNSDNSETLQVLLSTIPKTPATPVVTTTTSTPTQKESADVALSSTSNSLDIEKVPEREKTEDKASCIASSPPPLITPPPNSHSTQSSQQTQGLTVPQSGSSNLDYLIMVILVALLSVLLHKFYK
eukprot:TRINITY_DN896_c0_g1_i4.p1 TRINITY_DN896_c0_g1~~TRINITY_DN896_c0_g1_i4.p1  ORF type:complete len:166 (-),score=35.08 TRINITY_DN896_c0_g1_i4:58-555(-)